MKAKIRKNCITLNKTGVATLELCHSAAGNRNGGRQRTMEFPGQRSPLEHAATVTESKADTRQRRPDRNQGDRTLHRRRSTLEGLFQSQHTKAASLRSSWLFRGRGQSACVAPSGWTAYCTPSRGVAKENAAAGGRGNAFRPPVPVLASWDLQTPAHPMCGASAHVSARVG